MKRIVLIFMTSLMIAFSPVATITAQVNVSVNIGAQPLWGPVGYDAVQYYYLPDLQMYYYVPSHQFVYLSGGNWIYAGRLPSRYSSYNLYSGYKVVINEPKPYQYFSTHKVKYAKYKGAKGKQLVIRDSKDPKYYVVKGHPGNAKGQSKAVGGGNSGKGQGKGKGKKNG